MSDDPDGGTTAAVWLPTVIVVVALIASMVLPIIVLRRVNRLRLDVTLKAEPVRENLIDLFVAYASEISSFRAYLLDDDPLHLQRYRDARRAESECLARLRRSMPAVDVRSGEAIRRLEETLTAEHALHDRVLQLNAANADDSNELARAERLFSDVSGTVAILQEMVREYQAAKRLEMDRTVTMGGMAIAGLVLLGLFAAMLVSRQWRRLQVYSHELARRAREEAALRSLASGVNAAVSIEGILAQASAAACEVTGADGAYIESITEDKSRVEVIGTAGTVTPKFGTAVPYPGSLTEEILARRQPVIAPDIEHVGPAIAPFLKERCATCELLLVPLVSEDDELGALVVLNASPEHRTFRPEDLDHAAVIGNLAAVAMRRVRVMQRERSARATAEDAVRARDQILSVVSHDLRAPLTTISLSAQMIEAPDSTELRVIRDSVARMKRLVEDLLDVAQIERGHLAIRKTYIDPAELLRNVERSFGAVAANKKQELCCTAQENLPQIEGDPDRLMQVFANLVTNALKFTPERGKIFVSAGNAGAGVRFTVADTGPGIPPGALPHIFKRHWQARKTSHLGAGLGLTIAKGIVEAHGGTIEAENPPGGGAAFHFTIPAAG